MTTKNVYVLIAWGRPQWTLRLTRWKGMNTENSTKSSYCSPLGTRPRRRFKRNLSPPASWLCSSISSTLGFSSGAFSSFSKTTEGEKNIHQVNLWNISLWLICSGEINCNQCSVTRHHKARQRDEPEVWNRKITYINRRICPGPFSRDLLGGKLNCGKQNSLSSSSHISPLTQHFPKCQTDFNFNLLSSLDSTNMRRVKSVGWLCSYALYFPVWFMLQKTHLFLLHFCYSFYLNFFTGV